MKSKIVKNLTSAFDIKAARIFKDLLSEYFDNNGIKMLSWMLEENPNTGISPVMFLYLRPKIAVKWITSLVKESTTMNSTQYKAIFIDKKGFEYKTTVSDPPPPIYTFPVPSKNQIDELPTNSPTFEEVRFRLCGPINNTTVMYEEE